MTGERISVVLADDQALVRAGFCALEDALADIRADEFDSRPAHLRGGEPLRQA